MAASRRSAPIALSARLRRPLQRLAAILAAGGMALVVMLGGSGATAAVDDQSGIDRQVADASDAVADANAAVSQAAADLAAAQAELPPAQQKLDQAIEREAKARAAHEAAVAAYEQAKAEHEAAQQRLVAIEADYEGLRSNVGEFARRAYQMGPFAEVEMVLEASDPIELTDRLAAIRSVSKANNQALSDMATNRADQAYTELRMEALQALAEEKRIEAEEKLKEAEQARAEAAAAKALIDQLISQRDAALAVAEAQRSSVQGQYRQLRSEQARIAAAAQAAAELARRAAAGGASWSSADGFIWPIPGAGISQLSGPRIHPVYGYRSCHTGVDVRGGYGTPLLSVQSGVVAEINSGGPFGLHTIIAHGDGVASFYAHQSRTNVRVGQQVGQGDVIGFVGSTGWSTGPHLHFEMHIQGVPHNPLGWYGQSKTPINC
jgi:murein DD-endopeptidase MepM/ murein hydrolase activator NlpD